MNGWMKAKEEGRRERYW